MNAFFAQVYHSLFDVEYKMCNKAYVSLSKYQRERDKLRENLREREREREREDCQSDKHKLSEIKLHRTCTIITVNV